ncbi:MAG: peroxiredoxin [Chlamydiae bacterium]|nr:peroxiredoxin [Chlamydiota bacterium]
MELMIGKKAPAFKATAVLKDQFIENFSLSDFIGSKVVLFFYPLDFTFVCPTELHAFQEQLPEFEKRNTKIIGCSVDSHFSHKIWLGMPKKQGGIQGIQYPIISDLNKGIARSFGVLNEEEGIAFRGIFVLDAEGLVRHQLVNDLFIGRSVDEVLRVIDAIDFHEKHGNVCPANWNAEKKGLQATHEGVISYFS